MKLEARKRCIECGRIFDGDECPECGLFAQEYADPEEYDDDEENDTNDKEEHEDEEDELRPSKSPGALPADF